MSALEQAGIEAIAFKGPTLSVLAYDRLERAASGDLDLLVRPADLGRSLQVLGRLGYDAKGADGAALLAGNNEVVLTSPSRTEVDLHWRLSPVYFIQFDLDGAFRRSQMVTLIGREFRTLGNEDLFIGLAIHHARHCWNSWGLIRDVAHLARRQPLDWALLSELAGQSGALRVVNLAVLLAAELSPGAIPDNVLAGARGDRAAVRLAAQVRRNLEHDIDDFAGTPAGAWMQMRMSESWGDRTRYFWRRMVLPNQMDADAMRATGTWRPVMSLLRPLRVLGKAARQVFGQGRRRAK